MSRPPYEPPERLNIARYFLLDRLEEGHGGRRALVVDGGELTYAEVALRAETFARALREAGLRPEERALILLPDGADFVAALFGILELGAVAVMVNPALEPERLAELMDYSRAPVAITDARGAELLARARRLAAGAGPWILGSERGSAAAAADGEVEELAAASGRALEPVATHRDDPAIWLFSGGTTGRPKAVVQTHRSFANTTECYAKAALGYRAEDLTLSVPKLFFGYATGSNLFFPFAVGGAAILYREPPTPQLLFEKVARHRPTILINVPTMVGRMTAHPRAAEQDFSSLRFATSAGEALPVPLYERWREVFGVELLDGLGTAEMWHIFLSNLPGAVRPGTLGRAVPGFEVRVCDEDGAEVGPGEPGRLWVRGGSRALGYWRDLDRTAEAFRGEWFVGGDLVARDADGWVTYCGRGDDVLKVGGKWLVPSEVESCLAGHPAVGDCAVVGAENEDGLVKPYAFVTRRDPGPDPAELEAELKALALDRLQAYKHPRRVVVLETLPRTHLGKVDRAALKKMAASL